MTLTSKMIDILVYRLQYLQRIHPGEEGEAGEGKEHLLPGRESLSVTSQQFLGSRAWARQTYRRREEEEGEGELHLQITRNASTNKITSPSDKR